MRNGEASHADVKGALDAAVKAKLDNYQHDYNERNFFFLPAVMTTSGRISGDFLRLLYILSDRQADNYFSRMGLLDPSTKAFKQRRGSYFYYNRAAIGNIRLIVYRKYYTFRLSTLTPSISSWDRQQRRMMVCLSLGQEACSGV